MIPVNHVLSNDVDSRIFDDILNYFERFASPRFEYKRSVNPVGGALLRHYHRPNLENHLLRPCLVTVHHDLADTDDSLDFKKFVPRYREADLIVCLNTAQKDYLTGAGFCNTVVIPHGYNEDYLTPIRKPHPAGRKLTLGILSRRYGRRVKGEPYIYELAKRLDPDLFSFLLVGRDRTLDAKFLHGIGYDVRCYENLPYPVLCSAYEHIDLLLIASTFEGGPANIPEAVATATPILSSPVGMSLDFVQDGNNGLILSMNADRDGETIMNLVQHNADGMNALFEGALGSASRALTWRTVVKRYESQYQSIVNKIAATFA